MVPGSSTTPRSGPPGVEKKIAERYSRVEHSLQDRRVENASWNEVDLCRKIRLARFCDSPMFDSRLISFGRFSVTDSAHCTAVCTVFLYLNTCLVGLNLPQRALLLPRGHFCLRSFDSCFPRSIHLPSLHHGLIDRLLCISHVQPLTALPSRQPGY